ncbi:MAG: hypothetical protein QOJ88_1506 [Pyrinomonadaceae bacterium]|jgi:hypothetical protein|nr:hypothetical protein [Pyrinomonadaceae bacterium]
MIYLKVTILSVTLFLVTGVAVAAPAEEAPQWLQQAATLKVPTYDKDVPAVVLRDSQDVVVGEDGKVTTTTTYVVRILTREGRMYADAAELYLTQSGKIRDLNAWLIRPNGFVKKYGKDETVDRIVDANDLYNEYRVKEIDATADADVGVVFGYQARSEEQPLFNQDVWVFQDRLPTLESRYGLTLPAGWRATSVTFNHAKVEPSLAGTAYTWELQDLPPIKPEPASPKIKSLAPRVAINYFLGDSSAAASTRVFENWSQVSRWGTALHDPQAVLDASVIAKARELTANSKTELERIRAIAHFVQNLQYISIDIGVGRGNGYRPHSASQVLAKAYGDCKDKANLMRALLKALDITSYPVFIYAGDATVVQEAWASPYQFNHCIIAVRVSPETTAPTVLVNDQLGRLLIFDATDSNTPVGDLPEDEQGSFALLVAGDAGQLLRMPTLPPEASSFARQATVVLSAEGSITATVREQANGQTAADFRRQFRRLTPDSYRKMIEVWVGHGATGATVSRVDPKDHNEGGGFDLDVDFAARNYAQLMQDRLLVFKPAIISRQESLSLTEPLRKHPVVLDARSFSETVHVRLPAGFAVDELPDPLKLDTTFGSYSTTYAVKDGELVFTRNLAQHAGTIPVAEYQTVRSFFERIRAAEQAPVVLVKQ